MFPTLAFVLVMVLQHMATAATLTHGAAKATGRLAGEPTTPPARIIPALVLRAHRVSVAPSVAAVVPSVAAVVPLVAADSVVVIAQPVAAVTSVAADAEPRSR